MRDILGGTLGLFLFAVGFGVIPDARERLAARPLISRFRVRVALIMTAGFVVVNVVTN